MNWVLLFLLAAMLLTPVPLSLGNTGPHPALLFAALGLFAGAARLAEWRIPVSLTTFAAAGFFLVLAGSVAFAAFYSGGTIALASLARVCLFGIALYVFFYTAHGPGAADAADPFRQVRLVFGAAVLSAAFASVDFYFQFPAPAGFGPQFVWLDSGVYRRAQGVFYEASTLGNFCAFFLVMIAVALARPRNAEPLRRTTLIAGGVAFSAALVFSYSRASIANVAVALSSLFLLERSRLNVRRLAVAVAAGTALSAWLAVAVLPAFASAWWLRLWASAQYLVSFPEGVLSGRLASWRILGDFLALHPGLALVGIGYKTLPYTSALGRPVVADNMYLSILVETGVAGLAAMLLFHFALLRSAWHASRSADARASFFGTWFFCFWMGQLAQMLSGDLLTYWRVLPLYFWVLALAVRNADPVR